MPDISISTARLVLTQPSIVDAPSLLKLFNQPDFIDNIRDKNIRTLEDAQQEITETIHNHFSEHGFGLMSMRLADATFVGLCGLVKRSELPIPDIGFAMLSGYQGQGYITEAAQATLAYGFETLQLDTIAAIVKPDNMASIRVLSKLKMPFIKGLKLNEDEPYVKYFELQRRDYQPNKTGGK